MAKLTVIKLTEEQVHGLLYTLQEALATKDFAVATNVVLLRQIILNSPTETEDKKKEK